MNPVETSDQATQSPPHPTFVTATVEPSPGPIVDSLAGDSVTHERPAAERPTIAFANCEPPAVGVSTVHTPPAEPAMVEAPGVERLAVEPSAIEVPATVEPSPATDGALSADARRRLIERFEAWVDRMVAGDPPPAGVPSELLVEASADEVAGRPAGQDLYAVFAGLTGLTGEVRLQGRAFKQLAEVLAPVADLTGQFEQLAQSLAPAEDADEDTDPAFPKPSTMLEVFLDLYDRLGRGLRNADGAVAVLRPPAPQGWLDRLLGRTPPAPDTSADAVRAMRDGYALTLSRLTAALHQWDVEPIGRAGEPFDPRRMVAIDVRPAGDQPPGTVVEVNRSGSAVRGIVLTPAQVTVAR